MLTHEPLDVMWVIRQAVVMGSHSGSQFLVLSDTWLFCHRVQSIDKGKGAYVRELRQLVQEAKENFYLYMEIEEPGLPAVPMNKRKRISSDMEYNMEEVHALRRVWKTYENLSICLPEFFMKGCRPAPE